MSPKSNGTGDPPAGRARRADAERNRAALVGAARDLFDQKGPDVATDEIARRAGVANGTLYRHFPTRAELVVAVYAAEVDELAALAERLRSAADPDAALDAWLGAFVRHVSDKRELALGVPDHPPGRRGELFAAWHGTMTEAGADLLGRAQREGSARAGVESRDLLTLAAGIAVGGAPADRLDALLAIVRRGYAG